MIIDLYERDLQYIAKQPASFDNCFTLVRPTFFIAPNGFCTLWI